MMTGQGPFGPVEMGGMFTVLKVRSHQPRGDYKDPGWFKHPQGTQATEWKGPVGEVPRAETQGGQSMPSQGKSPQELIVRKPGRSAGH